MNYYSGPDMFAVIEMERDRSGFNPFYQRVSDRFPGLPPCKTLILDSCRTWGSEEHITAAYRAITKLIRESKPELWHFALLNVDLAIQTGYPGTLAYAAAVYVDVVLKEEIGMILDRERPVKIILNIESTTDRAVVS